MDWDDLRFVLAISRHGTLSAAAQALGVRHTTVARRLKGLERALGARLFDHDADGYSVTTQGAQVVEVATRTETELHGLESRVLGEDLKVAGKLRVTTMDILLRRYLSVFRGFLSAHPDVELTLTSTDVEASLLKREADVALRMTNAPAEYLVGRKVGKVEFAVYAAKSVVKRIGRGAPLRRFPWLHWDERVDGRWLDGWLAQHATGARVAMRMDVSSLPLRELIAAGIGVHHLATFEGDLDPRLERISGVQHPYTRAVWLLTLKELQQNARVRAFLDHFARELK